ncbi:alkene reductase [Halotalea alkalilenta]|uniref:Alkene reductase n=1 Tax=Halotalea alkalilenta TaxID=376489 RepID=A0A172YDE9_9GAMM|nr:alkene reductase [Halotalea alkalilenta]ANF57253.1 alkene reductase [Halotalea alkalilenta]
MNPSDPSPVSELFLPYSLGHTHLSNRIVMAPMTRSRAVSNAPDDSTVTYYAQRASAGLIITEGTVVSPQGRGFLWTPGIYSKDQIDGWKKVTHAVHEAGGKIFVQLWHVGRMSHETLQENNQAPVTSVESQILNWKVFAYDEKGIPAQLVPSRARALATREIHDITGDFVSAAKNAISAGFDGVEIHAANGYLFDQFINGGLNTRKDEYGGKSIANRLRFVLEAVDAIIEAIGSDRVGVRISPYGRNNDMPPFDDERETFLALTRALATREILYLHINEGGEGENIQEHIRELFQGSLILCGQYTRERAQAALASGRADLIAFGRPFIGNPDLVDRMRNDWPVVVADRATYYSGGDAGYIDFPPYVSCK